MAREKKIKEVVLKEDGRRLILYTFIPCDDGAEDENNPPGNDAPVKRRPYKQTLSPLGEGG